MVHQSKPDIRYTNLHRLPTKSCGFVNYKHQNMTSPTHTAYSHCSSRAENMVMYGNFCSRAIKAYNANIVNKNSHTFAVGMNAIDKRTME